MVMKRLMTFIQTVRNGWRLGKFKVHSCSRFNNERSVVFDLKNSEMQKKNNQNFLSKQTQKHTEVNTSLI